MVARVWSGVTPESKSAKYFEYLRSTGISDARATPGNKGVLVLKRASQGHAEFLVVSFWESQEAVRGFAGDEIERSRYYTRDREFLLDLEPEVTHYDVLMGP